MINSLKSVHDILYTANRELQKWLQRWKIKIIEKKFNHVDFKL